MPKTIIRRAAGNAASKPVPSGAAAGDPQLAEALKRFEAVIEYRAVAELKANPRNARRHSKKQVQQIAASIAEFGFLVPVLVDEDDSILAGHGRVEAATLLGVRQVPTVRVAHLTAARKRAFVLADNRLAELAEWDEEILRIELLELSGLELDFEFEVTGFDTVDLDRLDGAGPQSAPTPELVEEPDRKQPAVCAPGDLWQLGRHRLLCGSALEEGAYQRLLGDERAQLVFTDPPYNVKIAGHVCGLGSVKHKAFQMASGEMSEEEFTEFLRRYPAGLADPGQPDEARHSGRLDRPTSRFRLSVIVASAMTL